MVHEFAFFCVDIISEKILKNDEFIIFDEMLIHRINHIVRCQKGQRIILFNETVNVSCVIKELTKKSVTVFCDNVIKNKTIKPEIYLLLPLLKKEAFDESIYNCGQLGVTGIQFIVTKKCSRTSITQSELQRLKRINQASAEQSKQFISPVFLNNGQVFSLEKYFELSYICNDSLKIIADPDGFSCKEIVLDSLLREKIIVTVGPEGAFTKEEQDLFETKKFIKCALGPTVLRAQEAVTILIGMLRALKFK